MSVALSLLALTGGLVLLGGGANSLVRGSSDLALQLGMSPLAIGLTVVAFGTSSPELVVSLEAAYEGNGALALGNVIGSNIANIGLVLGAAVLIQPARAEPKLIRLDIPILIGCTLLLSLLLADGELSRLEGLFLTAGIAGYVTFTVTEARRESAVHTDFDEVLAAPQRSTLKNLALVGVGLLLLIGGANLLIRGAVALAERLGVTQAVIGLTVVAVGPSLPELATSLVAAYKKEADLIVGNVIGSNIFNTLGILGPAALLAPLSRDGIGLVSLAVMTGFALLLLPLMRTGYRLSRREGILLLLVNGVYLYMLVP